MTMDLHGLNPASFSGIRFHLTSESWTPLAQFVTCVYPDLTAACRDWTTNDGFGLNADQAVALAAAIMRDLSTGAIVEYAERYEMVRALLPRLECGWCQGYGVRTDEVGRAEGMHRPYDPVTGKGGCQACGGQGKVDHPGTRYRFDLEAARALATFLRDCGGFEIW